MFMGSTLLRGEVVPALPAPHLSVGLAAQVAMDEALLAMAMTPRRFPLPGDYSRVAEELAEADAKYTRLGWIDDPTTYYQNPPPLSGTDVETRRGWALGFNYDRLNWESEFSLDHDEPGGERWMAFRPNRTATANVLRHPGGPRPWVIAVHGFCMGFPFMDFQGLHASRLHHELGMNVAFPALPLHGPRRVTLVSGEPFLSFELMNAVHGLSQAVWDIRRLIQWVREQDATSISLYGVSLGAYTVSLLAGIEEDIDTVVAGIPVSDFPNLFHEHSPHDIRARAIEHKIMGGPAERVFRVVSPMSFDGEGASSPTLHLRRVRRPPGPARPGAAPLGALGQAARLVVRRQPRWLPVVQTGVRLPRRRARRLLGTRDRSHRELTRWR